MPNTDAGLAPAPAFVSFEGMARAVATVLRSPASDQPCVYWRLRIAQRLTDRSQLVHEIASEEAFELGWGGAGEDGRPEVRVRLEPGESQIHATPVLHREGSPGAEAAAAAFGLSGPLSVEEVLIRPGESLTA